MDFFLEYVLGWHLPEILCLVIGLILLIAEMFSPGFGVAGGLGIAALIAAVILRAGHDDPAAGLITLALILLIILLFGYFFIRSFQRGRLSRSQLVLNDAIESGPSRSKEEQSHLLGHEGVTINDLRPAGNALFGEERLDVVTEAGFIRSGTHVKITKVDGTRVVVMPITKSAATEAPLSDFEPASDVESDSPVEPDESL